MLCWKCANACGGCSWADSHIPVEGWAAVETYTADGRPYSYEVIECPEFDGSKRRLTDIDTDAAVDLLAKAITLARSDYIAGNKKKREEILYFLADWMPDQKPEVDKMKAEAREHDERMRHVGEKL